MNAEEIIEKYNSKKNEIHNRLSDFKKVLEESEEKIFSELAFCLCTPQSKATICWTAITSLVKNNLLFTGTQAQIRPFLNAVRFADNKSKYILEARNKLNGQLKNKLNSFEDPIVLRDWLVENIKGMGLKEASHFIRNVGLSDNKVAILDRHILKNLQEVGVIDGPPKSLTEKIYLDIEKKMKKFASDIGITLDELDLLFWSEETGKVFK